MSPTDDRLVVLIDALQLLAADPEVQMRAAPAFQEIARDMLDGQGVDRIDVQLREEGRLPEHASRSIDEIDTVLGRMLDQIDPDLWSEHAIASASEWRSIRALARRALMALGVAPALPSWLPGG